MRRKKKKKRKRKKGRRRIGDCLFRQRCLGFVFFLIKKDEKFSGS